MKTFTVPAPQTSFCGFQPYEPLPSWMPSNPPPPTTGMSHANAIDRAYVTGATHMARLHLERARAAARRLHLERTVWGVGILVSLVLGWAFARMGG